jgi:hypothetical protein
MLSDRLAKIVLHLLHLGFDSPRRRRCCCYRRLHLLHLMIRQCRHRPSRRG